MVPSIVLRASREGQAFEGAVEQLATAIRLGVFATGMQLPAERDLATQLGVSRETLREAMASLRQVGMIETRRGRGGGSWVIDAWKHRDPAAHDAEIRTRIEDVLDFRRVVEPGAVYLAASRPLTPADHAILLDRLAEVTELADNDIDRPQADACFHLAVAGLSGSPSLVESISRNQSDLRRLLALIPALPRNIEHSNADHAAIVDAIVAEDPEAARELAEDHCDKTAALLRGLLG